MTSVTATAYEDLRPYIDKASGQHRVFLIRLAIEALGQAQESARTEHILRLAEFERAKELDK